MNQHEPARDRNGILEDSQLVMKGPTLETSENPTVATVVLGLELSRGWSWFFLRAAEVWINVHNMLKPLENGRFLWASERSGFRRTWALGTHAILKARNHWPDLQNTAVTTVEPERMWVGEIQEYYGMLVPQLVVLFWVFMLFLLAYRITLASWCVEPQQAWKSKCHSSYAQLHNDEIVRHLYIYGPDASGEATLKPVTGGEWQVEEVVAVDEETLGIQLERLQKALSVGLRWLTQCYCSSKTIFGVSSTIS